MGDARRSLRASSFRSFGWLMVLVACREPAPPSASKSSVKSPSATPSASAAAPPRDARFVAAEAVLEAWRVAQNERNFDAYSALYAEQFRGTKRVGTQSFRFDRKHWLADRQPMFAPGLSVKLEHPEWAAVEGRVVVVFTQEFATPQYRDRGRKLLAFVATAGGYHIAREEMLSSEVLGGGGSVAVLPGFFAARADAVMLRSSIDDRWLVPARREQVEKLRKLRADPERHDEVPEEPPLTARDVVLPPEVQAMQGRHMFVWPGAAPGATEAPPPCEATITRVELHDAEKESFAGVRYMWGADALYGWFVRGLLDKPCPGALWASEAAGSAQFVPQRATGEVQRAAERAFGDNARARAFQAEYASSTSSSAKWYDAPLGAFVLGPEQGKRLLFVAGYHSGGEFERSLSLLFELAPGSARPRPLGVVNENGYVTSPRVACDWDGDGQLELLTGPSDSLENMDLVHVSGGKVTSTTVYFEPAFVCPG